MPWAKPKGPRIEVSPAEDVNDISLAVRNLGTPARFEAHVEVVDGRKFSSLRLPRTYVAAWRNSHGRAARILEGQSDEIRVASVLTRHGGLLQLRLFCHSSGKTTYVDSSSWLPDSGSEKPVYILRVTMSAKPPLLGGPSVRTYRLTSGGLEDLTARARGEPPSTQAGSN